MNEQLVVKHIKTKNKVRKIVTYRENSELRKYHEDVVKYLNNIPVIQYLQKHMRRILPSIKMLSHICTMIFF
ncbi:MAG: hypothetical protein HDR27_09215 [Lachnospiraceae bacterium]|nr:hypothetical protein [Lachnospiraceae bacterium]